jgi:hypothetical protein
MQRLEVSDAVRNIYVVTWQRVKLRETASFSKRTLILGVSAKRMSRTQINVIAVCWLLRTEEQNGGHSPSKRKEYWQYVKGKFCEKYMDQ